MPQLHFEEQGRPLFVHLLRSGRTVIGRSDRCDIALPSESVSRVHCIVEMTQAGCRLLDRSRHGTMLNDQSVAEAMLEEGDRITLGIYQLHFSQSGSPAMAQPTASAAAPVAVYEQLVDGDEHGVVAVRACLRFTRGGKEGQRVIVTHPRTSLGGPGAQVEINGQLPHNAAYVRVVRGRSMVEPGSAAVYLAGARVRDITPVQPGEEVRLGDTGFVIDDHTDEDDRELASFGDMVGAAPSMRRLFGAMSRMAGHDSPVLLVGESGTGKELAARGVHEHSSVSEGPFVAVNCAAIAKDLVESELFGHEKGAFTGATSRTDGAFHQASGGTLFLDEIGEMPLELQATLLRALESGEVRRVGGHEATFPDARVIAATNRHLVDMIAEGTFREDLYWRLAVLTVRLPALRERPEDIPVIARTLLARHYPDAQLTQGAEEALCDYAWPGNVREMRNVLTRAYIMAGPVILASALSFNPWSFEGGQPALPLRTAENPEKARLREALRLHDGNRSRAAHALGMPRSTLLYKLRKYGLTGK